MVRRGKLLIDRVALTAALLFQGMGCGPILGIEGAECDPALAACQTVDALDARAQSSCEMYCNTVMANCTGEHAVYVGVETCMSVCQLLPPGMEGDTNINSVSCRLKQAVLAKTTGEPNVQCAGAGPGGTDTKEDDLCGTSCEGLCTIMARACMTAYSDCFDRCNALPDNGTFNISMNQGNNVQCRLWHASAATQAAVPHCEHANGASPCD